MQMARRVGVGLLATLLTASAAVASEPDRLDALLTPAERAEVLELLAAIDPSQSLRELSGYASWQHELGGGLHGLMPDQSEELSALPVPDDEVSRLEAAAGLAELRHANRVRLAELGYPVEFTGQAIAGPDGGGAPARIRITLDDRAIRGFLEALDNDGVVDEDEARRLAGLPSNREMMRHRRDLGYVPEPLVTEEGLAALIRRAGSGRPLDRLWAWVNPLNFFGYADVVNQRSEYERLVAEIARHREDLTGVAAARIAAYLPADVEVDETFALTVGCLIRGWATAAMSGLNVEQVKDDWPRLRRTMTEEVYHRVQLKLMPSASGVPAHDFEDLVVAVPDEGLSKLYELLVYTVAEGTANLAATPAPGVDDAESARAGRELLDRFVAAVVRGGRVEEADALLGEGLSSNGPLYSLGYRMAQVVERHDGTAGVGGLLRQGPVTFVLRAIALADGDGVTLVSDDAARAVRELAETLPARFSDRDEATVSQ